MATCDSIAVGQQTGWHGRSDHPNAAHAGAPNLTKILNPFSLFRCTYEKKNQSAYVAIVTARTTTVRNVSEQDQPSVKVFVELQDRRHISTPVTIIWSRPNSDQVLVRKHVLIPLHHQLVCPGYELQSIHMIELTPKSKKFRQVLDKKKKIITSEVTCAPKSHPAPRCDIAQGVSISSGSDHIKSQKGPVCGISCLRSINRIWSIVDISVDNPP